MVGVGPRARGSWVWPALHWWRSLPCATPQWTSVGTWVTCGPRAGSLHSVLWSYRRAYYIVSLTFVYISSFLFLSLLPVFFFCLSPTISSSLYQLVWLPYYCTSSLCHTVEHLNVFKAKLWFTSYLKLGLYFFSLCSWRLAWNLVISVLALMQLFGTSSTNVILWESREPSNWVWSLLTPKE